MLAQSAKLATGSSPRTNMDRYQIDFEIKNVVKPDPVLVNKMNLDNYEAARLEGTDVEITDSTNNFVIVLYSVKKTLQRKALQTTKTD